MTSGDRPSKPIRYVCSMHPATAGMHRNAAGGWILYEDYERLERERAELRDNLEATHEALCIAAKKAGFMAPPALPPRAVWDNERQTFRCPPDEPPACDGCDKGLLLRDGVHIETYLPSGAEYVWGKCTAAKTEASR